MRELITTKRPPSGSLTPFEFVIARISVEDTGYASPCWLWKQSVDRTGYAKAIVRVGGRTERVHRAAYKIFVGEIGEGLQLDHLCRVRHCVNPAHLEAVTARENNLRSTGPAAINARKSHCIKGHEFSPENTSVDAKGRRWCLACCAARRRSPPRKKGEVRKPRVRATHCIHGHEYTPENASLQKYRGRIERRCRACISVKNRKWREKQKATIGKPGGNEAASNGRLGTHHSGTLSSTFPLDGGS